MAEADDLVRRMQGAVAPFQDLLRTEPRSALYRAPEEGAWSAMQVMAHVAEVMEFWSGQVRRVAESQHDGEVVGRASQDPDQAPERLAAIAEHGNDSPEQMADRLRTAVAQAAATLGSLPDSAWERRGHHQRWGDLTARELTERTLINHPRDHLHQAQTAMQSA